MFWKKKKDHRVYRVRVDGWLYIHADNLLTTDVTRAFTFDKMIDAFEKAKELHHDKDCCMIENYSGRVTIRTMDEIVEILGL